MHRDITLSETEAEVRRKKEEVGLLWEVGASAGGLRLEKTNFLSGGALEGGG